MPTSKERTRAAAQPPTLPTRVFAQASPHSLGGVSMFDADGHIDARTVINFHSELDVMQRAALRLQDAGFEILQITETTINIAAAPAIYEAAFGAPLVAEKRPVIKPGAVEDTATFIECHNAERPGLISVAGSRFADVLEGVAIEEPRYFHQGPLPFPPVVPYWHLDVPAGVSLGCNADRAHRAGTTGSGIKVAMVDSGQFAHPFFAARGYRVAPVTLGPAAANPTADDVGHGTAESANIFAVAPDVQLLPVKMSFVNTNGAFNTAVGLGPDIITCSWGSDKQNPPLSAADIVLATSIANAVASGIVVVFSAGNGHYGFPGQHPDVISAGGVFMDADGSLRASDYASGFASAIYAGRNVPDLSGLVGMRPRAAYIMLPLQPNCDIDQDLAGGGAHPNGDETPADDGWSAISGTSAAAPQLAGAAALVKQACPRLDPAAIRDVLVRTARDVTAGNCNPRQNNPAGPGSDLATGAGLVDAQRAVLVAKLRCRSIGPIQPITPIRPTPVQPITPIRPPITPVQPIRPPITPIRPPITPVQPVQPISPVRPPAGPQSTAMSQATPATGLTPEAGAESGSTPLAQDAGPKLTPEEIAQLEGMVMRGEVDERDIG